MRILLAPLLLACATAAFAQDCVPRFYDSEPRDGEWFYGAGKGPDSQSARQDALKNLVIKATGGDPGVPAEALAGWEQDDHGQCRGQQYALVRIEQAVVKRNRAALRAKPPEKAAPKERFERILKSEAKPVIVNNNITVAPAPAAGAPPESDVKYVVLAVVFLAFIVAALALRRPDVVPASSPAPADAAPDFVRRADYQHALKEGGAASVGVGQFRYAVFGRVGRGGGSDVYLGQRDAPLSERVVLKILRAGGDEEPLRREHEALRALACSDAQGTAYFSQRIPQVVALGPADTPGKPLTLVLRHHSGFLETLQEVVAAFPQGLDPRHGVWIWRRVLETLAWVHKSRRAHGAIVPEHLLVNARDHGVMLLGWSACGSLGGALSPRQDLTMTARCVAYALSGGSGQVPAALPRPLAELLGPYLDGAGALPTEDAFELRERVGQAAREAFGPPRFVELATPAWRS